MAAKFRVFAFDATTNVPKTGDAANLTAYVSKDYGAVTVLADTSATEEDATNAPGYYLFDAAQGETNADVLMVSGKSSTANIKVIGAPAVIYTRPTTGWLAPATAGRTLVVDAAGLADANMVKAGPTGSGTAQTARDLGASVLVGDKTGFALTSAYDPAKTAAQAGDAMALTSGERTTLAAAIWNALTSGLSTVGSIGKRLVDVFSGITSLAQWLGLLGGKQVGDSTARTELRATGAGSGTYDETTDSTQALRDRGDAAWITATGFSTLDAAGVRTAVGLASANLDTQIAALPTAASTTTAVWAAAARTLTANTNFNDPTAATVAAAVVAETMTELSAIPSASPTLKQAVALLYMALRNKVTVSATAKIIHNDAGTALGTKALSDDGTTYTEAEIA